MTERIAIIPARGGSKRLPRKNILEVAERPMLSYPVSAARSSGLFSEVYVSTEDDEILEIGTREGARVLRRPQELATDSSGVADVCLHTIQELSDSHPAMDAFCCIYPTAILINAEDLIRSFELLSAPNDCDVVMGVSGFDTHPYKAMRVTDDEMLTPEWPDKVVMKGQVLPEVYASNGTLYWARPGPFLRTKSFYAERLRGYVVPRERAMDIDTWDDLVRVRQSIRQSTQPAIIL